MLHVCTNENRPLYRRQLEQMHQQRYELFVKTKGWDLTVRDGGEYDDGDDDRAVYLLGIDETGACTASIRVRPADDFSMVIDRMPHFVRGDAARLREDPGLWEMARWVNVGNDRALGDEIRIGLIEYLLSRGATQCLALPDVSMFHYGVRTGWRAAAIGLPTPYPEGGIAIAVSLPITQEEAEHVRALTGRRDQFLIEVSGAASWATASLSVIEAAHRTAAATASSLLEMRTAADRILRAQLCGHAA